MDLESLARHVPLNQALPERTAHARDLWPRNTLAMRAGGHVDLPGAVAFPENEDHVRACLDWASEHRVAVVPWGAGSGVCGAAAGAAGALTLDLKRLRSIGQVDRGTVRVAAGVLGQHLEDELERQGFATRHSPSSIWCSTVGGWAASRSAGQFSSRYGTFADMVRAMRVVTPAGVRETGLWAGGEDLGEWFLGTEGALGVITELLVSVVPFPRARALRGYRFPNVATAWDAMRRIMQGGLRPAVLRLYDPVDTRIAGRGQTTPARQGASWLRDLLSSIEGIPALRRHLLSLPLALPSLVNALVAGSAKGTVLIAGWEGDEEEVRRVSAEGWAILGEGGEDLGEEAGEHWYAHRHDVSYKLAPIFERGGFADTMEVATTWSRLPSLYESVRGALARHALVMAHFSHAYREGCSIYFSFAGRGDLAVYDAAWRDALAAAAAAGATVAHHHGVGQLKQAAAARELACLRAPFLARKAELDPAGILNPGRLFAEVQVEEAEPAVTEVDAFSLTASLPAQAPAAERDAWLAERGWALRLPVPGPLSAHVRDPRPAWETRMLGATVRSGGRRHRIPDTPRSAAGPDARVLLPAEAYEHVTVGVIARP